MLKCKTCVFLVCFIGSMLLLFHGIYILYTLEELEQETLSNNVYDGNIVEERQYKESEYPILLWWTPFTGDRGIIRQCGSEKCFFTQNRSYINSSSLRALLFYGSDFNPVDLPLPRKDVHDWALLHEESPKNNFLFCIKEIMELFNHTATFRRESDFPLTLQYLDSLNSLTSHKYFKSTEEKDKEQNLAPVVYVQSDCNTPSERDSYVAELMKYIRIDSYGKCLHNKDLPDKLHDPIEGMDATEFWQLLSKYKFSLAFENAVCSDYITEKLWRPLIIGSVPIYYGSPSVEDWLPHDKAAIIVSRFDSPKLLANYLHYLNSNRTAYEYHLHHKLFRIIQNNNLKDAMQSRKWDINNDFEKGNFIEHFQCFVCERVSHNFKAKEKRYPLIKYQASLAHYGCPAPTSPLTNKGIPPSWWNELYHKARYEALAIRQLMVELPKFRENEYYNRVMQLLQSGDTDN